MLRFLEILGPLEFLFMNVVWGQSCFLFSPFTLVMLGANTTEWVETLIQVGFCVFSDEDDKMWEGQWS